MSGIVTSYSAPSGNASPSATMISGAAATTRGPPTCGATAFSTPRMSSGLAPSSSAFATCHVYDAGGASIAISAAIFTSAKVRGSSPAASSCASRRPIACSSICMSPAETLDSASWVSGATTAMNGSFRSIDGRLWARSDDIPVRHDLAPERHERHRDQLDVGDHGRRSRPRLALDVAAERPERVAGQLHRLHPERDGDDQDEHDEGGEQVADGEPEPGENQPQDVEQEVEDLDAARLSAGPPGGNGAGLRLYGEARTTGSGPFSARKIRAAFTRRLTSSASRRSSFMKIALMCFSTARFVR